jgi:hypothetical protein
MDTISLISGVDRSTHKWRPMPGELVSLWDMLRVHAQTFIFLMKTIARIGQALDGIIQAEAEIP